MFCTSLEEGFPFQNIHVSKDLIGITHTLKNPSRLAKIGTAMADMQGTTNIPWDKSRLGR